MASGKRFQLRSVKFEDIGKLRIQSNGFSGVWETGTSITIRRTSELRVESNAFGHESQTLGPILAIRHIRMLQLESRGLAAPLFILTLDEVAMNTCVEESFGEKINGIALNNVTIGEAETGCFNVLGSLSTFSIDSSKINTVHPKAFSFSTRELSIKNSNFGSIHERGFDIQTMKVTISDSLIGTLSAKGLSATANGSIRLNIRVNFLRENGLAGLRIQQNLDGYTQPLVIRFLDFLKSEKGSLAFAECAQVRMTRLTPVMPSPRVCPTERWARWLTGAPPSGPLTPAQLAVFRQLLMRHLCPDRTQEWFPTSRQSPHCEGQTTTASDRLGDEGEYDYEAEENGGDTIPHDDDWKDNKANIPHGQGTANDLVDSGRQKDVDVEDGTSAPHLSSTGCRRSPCLSLAAVLAVMPVLVPLLVR